MPIANRSTNVRAKPTGLGQPNLGGACEDGSNAARPRADVGEQESLLAERRGLGNNLAERRVESTWLGKATGRGSVNATISMCTDFLVGTMSCLFWGRFWGNNPRSSTLLSATPPCFLYFDAGGVNLKTAALPV